MHRLPSSKHGDQPAPELLQVRGNMSIMDFLDWLHIGWRLRRQYLDPAKCLALGGMHITPTLVVRDALAFGLGGADVDASNKQSYSGEV